MTIEPLPKVILEKAVMICDEAFWPFPAALDAVDKLSELGYAVTGVELFEREGDSPKWILSSRYEHDENMDWGKFVGYCRQSAVEFIFDYMGHEGGLFNLIWSENEKKAKKGRGFLNN